MKVSFSTRLPNTKPTGKIYEERDVYFLEEDLTVWVDFHKIIIPIGFETDYGSVPRGLWNLFPPTEQHCACSYILHDFLYSTKYFNRYICDQALLNGLKSLGISQIKCYAIYYGVRLGGGLPYKIERLNKIYATRKSAGIKGINIPLY
jgi:hypothetical protein